MKKNLIIFPNTLFHKNKIPTFITHITIYEHPHYFCTYNYNKKKIMLHRASMKNYQNYLNTYTTIKIEYIEFNDKSHFKSNHEYFIFDNIDKIKISTIKNINIIESPNFILSNNDLIEYKRYTTTTKNSSKYFFNSFYMHFKQNKNIFPEFKSTDKENRHLIPSHLIPTLQVPNEKKNVYIKEAREYTEKYFPNNCGNTKNFCIPISHKDAKKHFIYFIQNKFKTFAKYQDFISENNYVLYHSLISSTLNIGLINPIEIIHIIKKLFIQNKNYGINNFEAFIRQLFWREYQRFTYFYVNFDSQNYFGNKKKIDKKWYDGSTGIGPVDHFIKIAFDTGYLHHIVRLMIIGNAMNLHEIHPREGFRWFMEFSTDSYEWVMHQNVLDMVFFSTGGKTSRRPYICSANYVLKMSDFKKEEVWVEHLNFLYKRFFKKHKKQMLPFKYYFKNSI